MTWETIPGETPIDDVSGLRVPGITTRRELALHEAENIRKATVTYLAGRPSARRAPFVVAWMLQLHHEMFGDVWQWAGAARTTQKNLGVAASQILEELKKLEDDVAFWTADGSMTPAEISARIHHRAVFIHPFENGNGRWARMLANIWLRREGHPLVRWPEETIGDVSVERDTYLAAIRAADGGDLRPLTGLHERWSRGSG